MPVLAAIAFVGAHALSLSSVEGSALRLDEGQLLVGLKSGGIACFDPSSAEMKYHLEREGAPVREMLLAAGNPWWIDENGTKLFTKSAGSNEIIGVDPDLGEPIRRLSKWQNYVVAHGDTRYAFISSGTHLVADHTQILPADVVSLARQGMLLTHWQGSGGLLVVMRRYGVREKVAEGEIKHMGMLTAWSSSQVNGTKLLGSYVCDFVDFKDAAGPSAVYEEPKGKRTVPFGTGALGNLRLGAEGIIGVDRDELITIPFYQHNWVTDRIKTVVPPQYAQNLSYSNSAVWWSDGAKLYQANAEDGATDVYLPVGKEQGEVVSLAADEDGAWVLHERGIRRVTLGSQELGSFVRFAAGEPAGRPTSGQQQRLSAALNANAAGKSASEFLRKSLRSAGVKVDAKQSLTAAKNAVRVNDLQYGDVVLDGENLGFYVGEGKAALYKNGEVERVPLELSKDAVLLRFLKPDGDFETSSGAVAVELNGSIFPVGIGKPNLKLGHDLFARVVPGADFDRPHLNSHFALQQEMESWIGTPYRWGGSSLDGTDCSGFVTSVYRAIGISLPRHSQSIGKAKFGHVVYDELHYGDVLVFPYPKHVAIYVGNGQTIETTSGRGVSYSTVYRRNRAVIRRFLF